MNDLKGIIEDCNKSDLISDKVIKKIIEIIGQEEWNVLHDENSDICTTMGELIITLKGIPELEKENAELREKYLQATDEGTSFAHLKSLERENTKLKQQIEKMKCCGNCAKRGHICVAEEMQGNLCGKNKDKWELRR